MLMLMLLLQVNVVRERGNISARENRVDKDTVRDDDDEDVNVVDEKNAEKLSSQSRRSSMGETAIKFVGDTTSENIPDEDSGKDKGHGTLEIKAVMGDIIDVVIFNTEHKADITDMIMSNTE
jgi:hypothetical protein